MRHASSIAATILAISLSAPATAQEQRALTPAEVSAWDSVGRVNQGLLLADSTCTGALIAPDLVLTVAHCVPMTDTPLTFWPGFALGRPTPRLTVSARAQHPDAPTGGLTIETIPSDTALLRLSEPSSAAPLPLGPPPVEGEELTIIAYRNADLTGPVALTGCRVLGAQDGLVVTNCTVSSGMSGAPVLRITADGPELVAVLSASGTNTSFAAIPDTWTTTTHP